MKKRTKPAGKVAAIGTEATLPESGVSTESVVTHVEETPPEKKPAKAVSKTANMGAMREMLYFALRNRKLLIGLSVVLFFLLLALVGPYLAIHDSLYDISGPNGHPPMLHHHYFLGTTPQGEDVFAQFVVSLRLAFVVGLIGGAVAAVIGTVVGFTAGYKGGIVDEVLNMITNIVLCIPVFCLLIVIAAFAQGHVKGAVPEALIIGAVTWPWAARALRSQTFSLSSREFVSLARLTGESSWKIIFKEIAPNVSSYLFMMFILLFGGAILTASTLDFIGLGPGNTITFGQMMANAFAGSALLLGYWWWFIPPGIAITLIVGGAYFMNVGLDEVFNPRLREM
jgi:peptide/nickel transport system permease protein